MKLFTCPHCAHVFPQDMCNIRPELSHPPECGPYVECPECGQEFQKPALPKPQPNARFWVFWNDAWVKLTLRPRQTLRFGYSAPHEEGYGYQLETYSFGDEGTGVLFEWESGGRDCDGPIHRKGTDFCPLDKLRSIEAYRCPHNDNNQEGYDRVHHKGQRIHRPDWETFQPERIYDRNAELANY